MTLNDAETLALKVLQGDTSSIPLLLDMLMERFGKYDGIPFQPTKVITTDTARIRAVLYTDPVYEPEDIDTEAADKAVRDWIEGRVPLLMLSGFSRLELYEMPTGWDK